MNEEYKKDFDLWNDKKKEIESFVVDRLCHEREMWWCALGVNIGSEQDGKNDLFERPVIIVKGYNARLFLVVPVTGTEKDGIYYTKIRSAVASTAILSQLRVVDSKRFLRKIGMISKQEYLMLLIKLLKTILPSKEDL